MQSPTSLPHVSGYAMYIHITGNSSVIYRTREVYTPIRRYYETECKYNMSKFSAQ